MVRLLSLVAFAGVASNGEKIRRNWLQRSPLTRPAPEASEIVDTDADTSEGLAPLSFAQFSDTVTVDCSTGFITTQQWQSVTDKSTKYKNRGDNNPELLTVDTKLTEYANLPTPTTEQEHDNRIEKVKEILQVAASWFIRRQGVTKTVYEKTGFATWTKKTVQKISKRTPAFLALRECAEEKVQALNIAKAQANNYLRYVADYQFADGYMTDLTQLRNMKKSDRTTVVLGRPRISYTEFQPYVPQPWGLDFNPFEATAIGEILNTPTSAKILHVAGHGAVQNSVDQTIYHNANELQAYLNPTGLGATPGNPANLRSVLLYTGYTVNDEIVVDATSWGNYGPTDLVYLATCYAGYEPSLARRILQTGTRYVIAFKNPYTMGNCKTAYTFYSKWANEDTSGSNPAILDVNNIPAAFDAMVQAVPNYYENGADCSAVLFSNNILANNNGQPCISAIRANLPNDANLLCTHLDRNPNPVPVHPIVPVVNNVAPVVNTGTNTGTNQNGSNQNTGDDDGTDSEESVDSRFQSTMM